MDNTELAKSGKKRTIMIGIAVTAATVALMYYGCAFRDTARWKGNPIGISQYGVDFNCKTAGDVVVPREIDGVPVTCVSLSGNTITSVSLPDSVTELNFQDCPSLQTISVPGSIQIEYANEWGFAPKWLPHVSRRWSN